MLTWMLVLALAGPPELEICREAARRHCYEICLEEALRAPGSVLPDGQIVCDPESFDRCIRFNWTACDQQFPPPAPP